MVCGSARRSAHESHSSFMACDEAAAVASLRRPLETKVSSGGSSCAFLASQFEYVLIARIAVLWS